MDERVKERLVGMGVLLILGVIFIPLILDGKISDLEANPSQDLNLPVPSDGVSYEMSFSDGNVRRLNLPLPGSEGKKAPVAEGTSDNSKKTKTNPIPANGFVDELPKENDTGLDSKSDVSTAQNSTQKIISPPIGTINRLTVTSSSSTIPNPKSETSLKNTATLQNNKRVSGASAWVVQIGSFGDRKNAEKEVASLKAKGFPAFVRRFVSSEDKVLYRVRIGPEKDRTRAEKLFERLSKAGIKGQIVADP